MWIWFNSAISNKKEEISQVLADTDGNMAADILKKDLFTRLTLASQMDSKSHLEDSEIVCSFFWFCAECFLNLAYRSETHGSCTLQVMNPQPPLSLPHYAC